jgi:aminoglycoside 6'-N-acetyltransferase I
MRRYALAFCPENMNIRPISPSDLDSLAKLFAACFSSPPWNEPWTAEAARCRIAPMIETNSCRGLLATVEDVIVGVAFGQVEGWLDRSLFLLQELFVSPDNQNKGIAKALVAQLVSEVTATDRVFAMYLLTDRGSPAEAFYSKLGFSPSPRKLVMGAAVNNLVGNALV